jgi:hypothetical protein
VLHADAQQIPCAQIPLAQSPSALQATPFGRLVQTPLEQMLGAVQSPSAVHEVRHIPVPQTYGAHPDEVTVWQAPAPSQVRAGVKVDPVQDAATHVVPAA